MTNENWYPIHSYNVHEFKGYFISDKGRVSKTMSVCPECIGTRNPGRTILREELFENELNEETYLEFYYTLKDTRGTYVEVPSDFLQSLLAAIQLEETECKIYDHAVDTLDPEHPDYF
ncbi:MAG: hypothetical protein ACEQSC_00695 [Candidatus Nanopelagicaceae bacterium]